MFNIAVIYSGEIQETSYLKRLEGKKLNVYSFQQFDSQKQTNDMDAIIIVDSNGANEISKICETIIKIREASSKFIWILSDQSSKVNRIIYLRLGCDGIFDQKIDSEEFAVYVRLTLERQAEKSGFTRSENNTLLETIDESGLKLIPNNISVNVEGKREVHLTKLEFKALDFLIKNEGKALSYDEIYQCIWQDSRKNSKFRVANLICLIRKKIEKDFQRPEYIKTVRSKGYMIAKKNNF